MPQPWTDLERRANAIDLTLRRVGRGVCIYTVFAAGERHMVDILVSNNDGLDDAQADRAIRAATSALLTEMATIVREWRDG